jgi:hypothetical protein
MVRLTGGVLSVATIVLVLTFFPDKGQGLRMIFLFLSGAVLLALPLAMMVPDSAGERYRRTQHPGEAAPPAATPAPSAHGGSAPAASVR